MDRVGGKNASPSEMISALKGEGIRVPDGFPITADAYRNFLKTTEIEGAIKEDLEQFRGKHGKPGESSRTMKKKAGETRNQDMRFPYIIAGLEGSVLLPV